LVEPLIPIEKLTYSVSYLETDKTAAVKDNRNGQIRYWLGY
jgi:hypothetical protein